MNEAEVLAIFRQSGALLDGHFQLTSGLHSPRYFQCAKVLQYPDFAKRLCDQIAGHFLGRDIDIVIAPAIGGIVVAQEVGRSLYESGRRNIRVMFTERQDGVMRLRRGFSIEPGENVLVCEDVITTGGSVKEVMEIVRHVGGLIAGTGAIVNRGGGKVDLGCDLFTPFTLDVESFEPSVCPLCRQNIPVEKPGSRGSVPVTAVS